VVHKSGPRLASATMPKEGETCVNCGNKIRYVTDAVSKSLAGRDEPVTPYYTCGECLKPVGRSDLEAGGGSGNDEL
jgi:hypothetical protein